METFTESRTLVENPRYLQDRQDNLDALDLGTIDKPIVGIIAGFAELSHCFTLQSCYGHFLCTSEQDLRSLAPIPPRHVGSVRYRIAYIAFCLENSSRGRALRQSLAQIPAIDPGCVQFGSAGWFWERHVNSYALQVEPARYMTRDEVILDHAEALHIQQTRDLFFQELEALVARESRVH